MPSSLSTGTKLGRYEIRSKIGEGGMGEVYRARDMQLGRDVAIKVIPSNFAVDKDRLRRFEQEACAAGALNHPNVLIVHDISTHNGSPYVVSELLEGETLRQRISGTPLAQRRAIDYALQIANGLAAAHEKGIIHRDLKPDNIFITTDGRVKILDFGLAKLVGPNGDEVHTDVPTRRIDTNPGVIVGTVGYMSPEQLKGRVVDQRSDIFSFGAILYEMLSGRRAFHGESAAETMSAILKEDPPELSQTNQTVSPALERLVNRCLEKNPESRFHSASDLAFALDALSGSTVTSGQTAAVPAVAPEWIKQHAYAGWIAAAVATLLALLVFGFTYFRRSAPPEIHPVSFDVFPPQKTTFVGASEFISPDGERLLFPALGANGTRNLWMRPLGSLSAQMIPGTEDGILGFWSPDARFIGFFAGGNLKKLEITGGPPQTIATGASNRGGTWNRDGVIIFGINASGGLSKVSSSGGPVTQVTTVDTSRNETIHCFPSFLPDGRHFLYLARSSVAQQSAIYVGSLDSDEKKFLVNSDASPAYSPPGYLLFLREQTLMAQPFDAGKIELSGEPFPIVEHIGINSLNGRAFFSVSNSGVLVYRGLGSTNTALAWFDRTGKELERLGSSQNMSSLHLSPNDQRAVISRVDVQTRRADLWIVERGHETRFTFDAATDLYPVWSSDGSRVAYISSRAGPNALYLKPSSGAGNDELLLKFNNPTAIYDWSPDGNHILYGELGDLWVLPLSGERKPVPFIQSPSTEFQGRFSPDGRWIAYASNESGIYQIYVQSFPASGGKWMVSNNGGTQPRWRDDGKELFYISADRKLMAVDIKGDVSKFEAGSPHILFEMRVFVGFGPTSSYDVTRDGQRFLINTPIEVVAPEPLTVVMNWTARFKK